MTLEDFNRASYIQDVAMPNLGTLRYDMFESRYDVTDENVGGTLRNMLNRDDDFRQDYLQLIDKHLEKLNKEFDNL